MPSLNHDNDNRTASDEEISSYLLVGHTALCRADVGLIFGNRHCFEALAERAANLYARNYFSKILVSGGRPDKDGATEADILKDRLLDRGLPEKIILTERQSVNTLENVLFSRMLLAAQESGFLPPHKNIICIGTQVAGRRFMMTMKKHWPEAFAMASNVNPFPYPLEEWPKHRDMRDIVRREFTKAVSYKAKGDIAEIDLDKINRGAVMRQSRILHLLSEGP